jgi:hypothetical protein
MSVGGYGWRIFLYLMAPTYRRIRLKGGDTFNVNLYDTDDKHGDVMAVRK